MVSAEMQPTDSQKYERVHNDGRRERSSANSSRSMREEYPLNCWTIKCGEYVGLDLTNIWIWFGVVSISTISTSISSAFLRMSSFNRTTKSCGCWHEKHGDTGSRLYKCWQDMKARCEYKKDTNYHNYGGRGITVCEEWRNSYLKFKDWALKNGYTEKLTIDRIDVNGNYEPNNCRWVGFDIQANNTRANVFVEYNGEKMTLRQFARKYTEPMGVSYKTLWHRYSVAKWSLEKCVNTPLMNQ